MLKHLNNSFATAIIFALFTGLIKEEFHPISCHTVVFCIFFILFRVKTYIEDYSHFQKHAPSPLGNTSRSFLIALFVAIATWCLWILSGYTVISDEKKSCFFMALSLVTSTLWLCISMYRDGCPKNVEEKNTLHRRAWWVFVNLFMTGIFAMYIILYDTFSEPDKVAVMADLILLVLLDFYASWGRKQLTFD